MIASNRLCVHVFVTMAATIGLRCEKPDTAPAVGSAGPGDNSSPVATIHTQGPATGAPEPSDNEADAGETLRLSGLTMTVPEGWVPLPVREGPMAAKSAFALPRADGDEEDGMVRITYFPKMKGMDERNIDRWVAQVQRSDGTGSTRDDADIKVIEAGNVRLTLVDLSGTVKATMRAAPKPNGRLIAAIVDHPRGPHFVVASGGAKTMKKWERAIRAFLESSTAN